MVCRIWDDISEQYVDSNLLLGNGFSRNISERFGYASLFDKAFDVDCLQNERIKSLSRSFDNTHQFEELLETLHVAGLVNTALNSGTPLYDSDYDFIRTSLANAVRAVHPTYDSVQRILLAIGQELKKYSNVYTTNYDLLIYWAITSVANYQNYFCDYFWSDGVSFDPFNTDVWGRKTKLIYLHGALHLLGVIRGF